jgi:cysteinyl-tRNA synthetase
VIRLYDTRLGSATDVRPARPGQLRMYARGPTVDRYAHLGDLRTFMLPDLIRRTAERQGLSVVVCQAIADVGHPADVAGPDQAGEDKILAEASAEGKTPLEIARSYEDACRADCAALNILPPDFAPRASESIDLIIDMIAKLIETGHAYVADSGSVYFDARSVPYYGALSGDGIEDPRPDQRPAGDAAEEKRGHADWALWRNAPPGRDMTWAAPWATGYPGQASECSAMSLKYLGDVIDIHTSGVNLRFPHDEDERAQSNALAGHEVVRHWVHGEQVLFEGRTLAKSTPNVVQLSDLARRGLDPLAARLAFLEHRYRQRLDLTWQTLTAADGTVRRWREQVADWADEPSRPMCAEYSARIAAVLDDDLNTPAALQALRDLAEDPEIPAGSKFETFASADRVLGLDLVSLVGRPRPAPATQA